MNEFKCDKCDKVFENYRQLNGHKSSHSRGVHYGASRKKFADKNCANCGDVIAHNKKYCSLLCQQKWQWENITKQRVLNGNGSAGGIKRYLKEERGDVCEDCGIGNEWNGKPLTIQLDHIDGDSDNNELSNVRLICPNCHTQTETWGSKGLGSRYKKHTKRNSYLRKYKD